MDLVISEHDGGGGGGTKEPPPPVVPRSLVRQITKDAPLDLFINGITIADRPYPPCTRDTQESNASQYARQTRSISPKDRFTAYIYAHQTTVQIPIEKHCYLRVPDAWVVYHQSQHFVDQFLTHLVQTLFPRDTRAYRATIRATMVFRRHGIGYKPKIASPPTNDSAEFPFLHIFCSNPFLYAMLKSKLSSHTTKREYMKRDFYERLFKGTSGIPYLLKFRNPFGVKTRSNVIPDARLLADPKSREWFVAHETDINATTMALANLGITSNGWIRLTRGTLYDNRHRTSAISNSTFEVTGTVCARGLTLEEVEETKCSDMAIAALDIECQSATRGFPAYHNAGDVVNYVGLVKYSLLDMTKRETFCLCLGDLTTRTTDDGSTVDSAHMRVFEHETELLNAVPDFINRKDIDVLTTYNGTNFDYAYLDGRAVMASFVQYCDSYEAFSGHVETYHRAHLNYMDLKAQLVDLAEDLEWGRLTAKAHRECECECFRELNSILGYGAKKAWREPQPRTIHHAMWRIWPKERSDTPRELRARNAICAYESAKQLYEYFHDQPPIRYHYMHRLRAKKAALVYKQLGSNSMGDNCLTYPDTGRVHIDQFLFVKNGYKLGSYKLNDVANHFLGVTKYDMPYTQLFDDYDTGDCDKRRRIADYCVQDCDLLRQLDAKINITFTVLFMFKMTRTPPLDICLRGQQIRVFNCLYQRAGAIGAIFNSKLSHQILTEYQGATVLDPKPGIHGGPTTWVQVLDFKSLYPSIIIAMLLCMMNLVLPDDVAYALALEKAGKIPPLHRIVIDPETTYYFSRNPNCIIAGELRRLMQKRDDVKRVMKQWLKKAAAAQKQLDSLTASYLLLKNEQLVTLLRDPELDAATRQDAETELAQWTSQLEALAARELADPEALVTERQVLKAKVIQCLFEAKMQDVLQLAIKVVMNSFYGFFGVKEGMMPGLQPIAVCTTYYGRDYIQRTKRFLINLFQTHSDYAALSMDIIYGDTDSVFVKTWPIVGLANAIRIGEDMGIRTTRDEFKGQIILEWEKLKNPLVLFEQKKLYFGRTWTCAQIDKAYIYLSGVVEKRRDNAALTRKMYKICRESIVPPVKKGAKDIIFETVAQIEDRCAQTLVAELSKLEDDAIPFEDYVITKSLRRAPENYKQPVQAHVALAMRLKQRIRDGTIVRMPPISGDRLPYVVCEHPTSAKLADKVEDVDCFTDAGTQTIDRPYYVKASTNSIVQLYSAIMDVRPLFTASANALKFEAQRRKGQTQLFEARGGVRAVQYQRLFYSRQCKKRSTTQLTLFGQPASAAGGGHKGAVKAKKPKKRSKPKPVRMRPLF